jgi:hypothetical protein
LQFSRGEIFKHHGSSGRCPDEETDGKDIIPESNVFNHYQQHMYGKRSEIRLLLRVQPPDQGKIAVVERELIAIRERLRENQGVFRHEVV